MPQLSQRVKEALERTPVISEVTPRSQLRQHHVQLRRPRFPGWRNEMAEARPDSMGSELGQYL